MLQLLNHTAVDYLSIDIEGSEWDTLQGLDWSAVQIRMISLELSTAVGEWHSEGADKRTADLGKWVVFLRSQGYWPMRHDEDIDVPLDVNEHELIWNKRWNKERSQAAVMGEDLFFYKPRLIGLTTG